jgi:RHS repeat-associated protein
MVASSIPCKLSLCADRAHACAGDSYVSSAIDVACPTSQSVFAIASPHELHGDSWPSSPTGTSSFCCNQQFSITAITNSTGAISERYAYTAYGQPTILDASGSILSASTISNRYTYTGREWDATLGLHHFRARWMSPSAGRFLGRDPIGYVDYHLLYAYVRGGALVALDPTGLVRIECKCACRYGRFSVANVETDCNEPPYLCCLRACQRHGEKCFYEGGGWRNVGDSLFNDDIPISNWPKWPYDLPSFGDPQPPRPPALMGYGHYCGPNRKASCIRKPDGSMIPGPGQPPPIDDMDLACMQHDCCLADAPQVLHAIACRSPCNVLFCRALDAFNCDALYYKDPIQRYWCERMKQKAQGLFCLPAAQ